ncbi:hypothetical protein HMPREF9551_02176 [Escherichia coli MS 196-1]|nr:hypothetical protein HMPREF9551_02176 [Escherichia coli MS 196-1]EHW68785.1 hypothetical protein ECDEC10C_5160 [Escherichia coli DEC10C]
MFDNHNFMKIMMMFRKIRLREPGFYRHGRVTRRKKSTLCNTVILAS